MMAEQWKRVLGYMLIIYIIIHIVLNLGKAEVFFLISYVKMPIAFVVVISAAMGAAAVYLIQFMRKKKEEDEPKSPVGPPDK
ncbi:MAG: hypothetical protein ACYTAF_13550 [Planctomycetota bacterium]|jgi:uncharacterized integral membrane protein